MERPERPSRPDKGIRGSRHRYREGNRLVSSDSDSDLEGNVAAVPLYGLGVGIQVQRPSRPSVDGLSVPFTNVPLPLQNSLQNSESMFNIQNSESNFVVSSSPSTSGTEPAYHSPSHSRLRDTQNRESIHHPLSNLQERTSALLIRKRPAFIAPISGGIDRRSNSRNCNRVTFSSPLATTAPYHHSRKRFCPDTNNIPYERSDHDEPHIRPPANSSSWQLGAGPSSSTSTPNNIMEYFNNKGENSSFRTMVIDEIVSNGLNESNGRNSHSGMGLERLRQIGHASHSSSVPINDTSIDHPTRTSSHILRALDELRFNSLMSEEQAPWLRNEHLSHSISDNLELNDSTNTSVSTWNRSNGDFSGMELVSDGNDSENDHSEAIGTNGGSESVPVEEVSDSDDFDHFNSQENITNRQAVLTQPPDTNALPVVNNSNEESNNDYTGNRSGNDQATSHTSVSNNDQGNNELLNDNGSPNNLPSSSPPFPPLLSNNTSGAGDDVIILTMTPSPRRSQESSLQQLSQESSSQSTVGENAPNCASDTANSTYRYENLDSRIDQIVTSIANNFVENSISNLRTKSSDRLQSNSNDNLLLASGESSDDKTHMDCEEFNSKLISLLECPVCMETIVPPIHQCRKGHPVCQFCRPKLNVCPTCRSRFSENRNLLMEKVADMMLFPCKNMLLGCSVKVQLKDKKKHEKSCGFRQYDCVVSTCNWKGFKQELVVHVSSIHKSQAIVGDNQTIRVPLRASHNVEPVWVLSAMDEVFTVTFIKRNGFLSGSTVYLGDMDKAKNFLYEFNIATRDRRMKMKWTAETLPDKGEFTAEFLCTQGFSLACSHMIIDDHARVTNKIDVTIRILRKEVSSSSSLSL